MKIEGKGPVRAAAGRRVARRNDDGGGFRLDGAGGSGAASSVGPTQPLAAVETLLALQEVPDAGEQRRRAVAQGFDLLAQLDQIRLALLNGCIGPDRLRRLSDALRARRAACSDPHLAALLDDIELRAAVELAKLERLQTAQS